ncbi:hypothetical protein LEP1GSC175_3763 [Leptospira santarosai str. HAI821]|nr:hypothetical protein LEP1GSC169_2508 [Leptospira santarosai str. HAI1349]EMO31760.1 hypothetical protein LEP1GSC175_3763 [Leptospira santarosai str. HAI821]
MPMRGNLRFLNILWDHERLTMEGTPEFSNSGGFRETKRIAVVNGFEFTRSVTHLYRIGYHSF